MCAASKMVKVTLRSALYVHLPHMKNVVATVAAYLDSTYIYANGVTACFIDVVV